MGALLWAFLTAIGLVATAFLWVVGFGWASLLGLVLFWALAGYFTQNTRNYDEYYD